jgi:hypothetical protein
MTDIAFTAGPVNVPPHHLTPIELHPDGWDAPWARRDRLVGIDDTGAIVFRSLPVQRELLLQVAWQASPEGRRFAHTRCSDGYPLHSEAIEAAALTALSGGRQLLRGTTWTGPGAVERVTVEVWHDGPTPLFVEEASVTVRTVR